jgi:hypothetical protein
MRQRFTRLKLPEHTHWLVRRLFEEMNEQRICMMDVSERAGLNKNTMENWRRRTSPTLLNIEAALNVLGYELTIRRRKDPI